VDCEWATPSETSDEYFEFEDVADGYRYDLITYGRFGEPSKAKTLQVSVGLLWVMSSTRCPTVISIGILTKTEAVYWFQRSH